MSRIHVGILIFPLVEVLDFAGPFEVFSVARLDESRRLEDPSPFEVHVVAESDGVVTATGGLRITPDVTIADCPPLDILVVPGGWGTRREITNPILIEWIARRGREVATLTSVCTGAMLLGTAGLLDGRRATTHWRSLDWMTESFPAVTVERDAARRRGRQRRHLGGDLGGHRHGAPRGHPDLRRGRRARDGPPHGIPLPRRQSSPHLTARRRYDGRWTNSSLIPSGSAKNTA